MPNQKYFNSCNTHFLKNQVMSAKVNTISFKVVLVLADIRNIQYQIKPLAKTIISSSTMGVEQ